MQIICKQRRMYILLLMISFLLLGISLIITWMNPADKYEASIFLSTPSIYWVSLLLSLFISFFIVIKFNFTDESRIYKNSALLLLFIAYASFLALWIIRGYYLWCPGDPLTHLGWIKDILFLGHTHAHNIYPITHIFLAQISTILNIDPIIPHKYLPILFGLLYVFFMYQLAKSVLSDKLTTNIVLLISFIPVQGFLLILTPNALSNLLFPFACFILIMYIRHRRFHWCVLLLIMIFLYPVFHIVPSLALFIMMISLTPPIITFFKKTMGKLLSHKWNNKNDNFFVFGVLFLILIIIWISSFKIWDNTIQDLYILVTEGGTTQLNKLTDDILYATSYGYNVISQFFKVYGGLAIYLILTVIGFIMLWKNAKNNNKIYLRYQTLFWLIIPLFILILIMALIYLTNIIFSPTRLEIYIIVISVLYISYFMSILLRNHANNKLINLSIPLFLVGLFVIAAPKIYPSPYTLESNWQITRTEIIGMDWLLNKKTNIDLTALSMTQPGRFAHVLLSPEERSRIGIPLNIPEELLIPYHFGYDENRYLGDYYNEDLYMVLTYHDRILYKEVFPEIEHLRFTDNDFEQVENDNTIIKFYANGGFDCYYICSYQDAITS